MCLLYEFLQICDNKLGVRHTYRMSFTCFYILFLLYICYFVRGGSPPTFQKVDNPAAFHSSLVVRVSKSLKVTYKTQLGKIFLVFKVFIKFGILEPLNLNLGLTKKWQVPCIIPCIVG